MSTQQVKASLGYRRSYLKKKRQEREGKKGKQKEKVNLRPLRHSPKCHHKSPALGLALWAALVGHLESMGTFGKPHLPSQDLVSSCVNHEN